VNKHWYQMTHEERTGYADTQIAETKRQFRNNREQALVRKIRHLRDHGLKAHAESLVLELVEWRAALAAGDPEPEATVTPVIEATAEDVSVPIPDEEDDL
jgi:hypothetical protein